MTLLESYHDKRVKPSMRCNSSGLVAKHYILSKHCPITRETLGRIHAKKESTWHEDYIRAIEDTKILPFILSPHNNFLRFTKFFLKKIIDLSIKVFFRWLAQRPVSISSYCRFLCLRKRACIPEMHYFLVLNSWTSQLAFSHVINESTKKPKNWNKEINNEFQKIDTIICEQGWRVHMWPKMQSKMGSRSRSRLEVCNAWLPLWGGIKGQKPAAANAKAENWCSQSSKSLNMVGVMTG